MTPMRPAWHLLARLESQATFGYLVKAPDTMNWATVLAGW